MTPQTVRNGRAGVGGGRGNGSISPSNNAEEQGVKRYNIEAKQSKKIVGGNIGMLELTSSGAGVSASVDRSVNQNANGMKASSIKNT